MGGTFAVANTAECDMSSNTHTGHMIMCISAAQI